MEKILEEKQLPKECNRQEARRLQARMVRRKDHDCVVEETIRREALEPPDCEAMKKEYGKTLAQKHLNEKEQQKWSIGFKIQFNTWFCELEKLLLLWFCEAKLHDRKILSEWRNCQVWLLREKLKARLTSMWHWSCQMAWISSWTVWSNFTCHPLLQLKMCWTEIATHWLKMCFHTQCCWKSARGMEIPISMESGTLNFYVTFCCFRPNQGQRSQSDDNLAERSWTSEEIAKRDHWESNWKPAWPQCGNEAVKWREYAVEQCDQISHVIHCCSWRYVELKLPHIGWKCVSTLNVAGEVRAGWKFQIQWNRAHHISMWLFAGSDQMQGKCLNLMTIWQVLWSLCDQCICPGFGLSSQKVAQKFGMFSRVAPCQWQTDFDVCANSRSPWCRTTLGVNRSLSLAADKGCHLRCLSFQIAERA